jgi:hypothetical protein
MLLISLIFGVTAAIVLYSINGKKNRENLAKWRAEAEAQFSEIEIESPEPRYCFNGLMAEVVQDREEKQYMKSGYLIDYRLTRFARNTGGEYFMFISNRTAKPFLKHITQPNARIALKDRYLPPKESA